MKKSIQFERPISDNKVQLNSSDINSNPYLLYSRQFLFGAKSSNLLSNPNFSNNLSSHKNNIEKIESIKRNGIKSQEHRELYRFNTLNYLRLKNII